MIRVVRVLEYTYPDIEAYERDQARWTHASPPITWKDMQMRTVGVLVGSATKEVEG